MPVTETDATGQHVRPRELAPAIEYPQFAIATDILRHLMVAEPQRALFADWTASEVTDRNAPPYRATAFWPVAVHGHGERLYPFLRARYGGEVRACTSALFFEKGEPYAGEAWAKIATPIRREDLPSLADCAGDLMRWRASWEAGDIQVPARITRQMGGYGGYAELVRSVACIGVETRFGPIVFCIDSARREAFSTQHLSGRIGQDFRALMQDVPRRAAERRDFWSWFTRDYLASKVIRAAGLLVLVAACFGTVAALSRVLHADVVSRWAEMAGLSLGVCALAFLSLMSFLLFNQAEGILRRATEDAASRIQRFVQRWFVAWLLLPLSVLLLALSRVATLGWLTQQSIRWDLLSEVAHYVAAYYVLGAYSCVSQHARSDKRFRMPRVATWAFVFVGFALAATPVSSWILGTALPPIQLLTHHIAAALVGLAFCLLVGRLDSRLIGAPPAVVAALYLDALVHALCFTIDADYVPVVTALRMPLDFVLFTVVAWTIDGKGMQRYLEEVQAVAAGVPRRRLYSVWREWRETEGRSK